MADQEFEEFRHHFEALPQHLKATDQTYKLVHAITPLEEHKSFLEKVQLGEKLCGIDEEGSFLSSRRLSLTTQDLSPVEKPQKDAPLGSRAPPKGVWSSSEDSSSSDEEFIINGRKPMAANRGSTADARRRRAQVLRGKKQNPTPKRKEISLMDELKAAGSGPPDLSLSLVKADDVPCDVDSGNSTNHSPSEENRLVASTTDVEGYSPLLSPSLVTKKLELLDPTHRGLHRFIPRHPDEIEVDIGDPIYVQKEAEDLWCEGANLRTGQQGVFPLAYVVDVEYNDFDPHQPGEERKERYLLDYLGSIESHLYKGNAVLCTAVSKILASKVRPRPHTCVLEISDKGIKLVDKTRPSIQSSSPRHDYFYSLKNVTFCGFHPRDPRYFGFVTKHPRLPKYACHVFAADGSTEHIAEACGRAFQRFYQKFLETAYPIEDIYLE